MNKIKSGWARIFYFYFYIRNLLCMKDEVG